MIQQIETGSPSANLVSPQAVELASSNHAYHTKQNEPACPRCGADVAFSEYDFGACSETGYHDAGERYSCVACGATGDAEEVCQ